jgi:hypothetical protein
MNHDISQIRERGTVADDQPGTHHAVSLDSNDAETRACKHISWLYSDSSNPKDMHSVAGRDRLAR